MFRIVKKERLNPTVTKMVIDAPFIAKKRSPASSSFCARWRTVSVSR